MVLFKKWIKNEKGFALTFVLLVLVVVSILGLAIIGMTTSAFKMTRIHSDSESAYYIAEGGVNYTIDWIRTKVNDLYDRVRSADEFFANLESNMNKPIILDTFESNFGRTPEAMITITGSRRSGEDSADYTITSRGRIGNSTRTVKSVITVNWTENGFAYMKDIFLYGSKLKFTGSSINGEEGTIIFDSINLDNNPSLKVSNLYFNASVTLDHSSGDIGNRNKPGKIYINGDLNFLSGAVRDIFGDVYVNGNLKLAGARLYGNVYVNGDVELDWTPQIHENIYYTGILKAPEYFSRDLLDKCIKVDELPDFEIPLLDFELREGAWYAAHGYTVQDNVSEENIPDHARILANHYYSDSSQSPSGNIIIISKGDIVIKGWRHITGVLIAPNGSVFLEGGSFTGIILSKGGVITERGGWDLNMKQLSDFFTEDTLPVTVSKHREIDAGGEETDTNEQNRVIIKSPVQEK